MHLWTEYEGRTIAEHYTLGRLLRSEGRNGFFATADKDGHPAVIRLTEAHFDEAEQLERWRHVAEVHQDNLIEIEQVGQTTFEGVALTFALMEPNDANLGDVLKERPLTSAETVQVARAVLAALQALHTSGLVHEHIRPENVLAVGETVKLRSDCVRECVPDGEFHTEEACADLRRRDLHDLGVLLLRCLTLESEWAPAHNNLPDPLNRLIPRALEGTWSLEQLSAALEPVTPAFAAPRPAPSDPAGLLTPTESSEVVRSGVSAGQGGPSARRPLVPPGVRQLSTPTLPVQDEEEPHARHRNASPAGDGEPSMPLRSGRRTAAAEPAERPSRLVWFVLSAVALLVLWLGWHFFLGSGSGTATSRPPAATNAATPPVRSPLPSTSPAVERAPSSKPAGSASPRAAAPGWYVIAFTYNHEDQAATKVQRLRRNHNSLHPQVFAPTGSAPYLVSLGGAMSQGEAEAVYRHARRAGLPHDTFLRHY